MPGPPDDDLEPIDTWPDTGLQPLDDLDEDPEDTEDELPGMPELSPLPALDPSDLAITDDEPDDAMPKLPQLLTDSVADLGPPVVVLSWETEATVDGQALPAHLCPSEADSVIHDPSATVDRRTVCVTLGPVSRTLEVRVLQQAPARLFAGRDLLGDRILVSSTAS